MSGHHDNDLIREAAVEILETSRKYDPYTATHSLAMNCGWASHSLVTPGQDRTELVALTMCSILLGTATSAKILDGETDSFPPLPAVDGVLAERILRTCFEAGDDTRALDEVLSSLVRILAVLTTTSCLQKGRDSTAGLVLEVYSRYLSELREVCEQSLLESPRSPQEAVTLRESMRN